MEMTISTDDPQISRPAHYRPPGFKPCPHCHREFGSKSMRIHLTKCSEAPNVTTTTTNSENESSSTEELNKSWPKSTKPQRKRIRRRRRPTMLQRPKTAVLPRPRVLDESLKDKVDMTLTKKNFLAAIKICTDFGRHDLKTHQMPPRNLKAPLGYKTDNSHRGPRDQKRQRLRASSSKDRTLTQQSEPNNNLYSPERKMTKIPKPQVSHIKKPLMAKMLQKSRETNVKVPNPCNSCGRSDLPERFHTHPHNETDKIEESKIPKRLNPSPQKKLSISDEDNRGRRRRKNHPDSSRAKSKSVSPKKDKTVGKSKSVSPNRKTKQAKSPNKLVKFSLQDRSNEKLSADESDNQMSSSSNPSCGSGGSNGISSNKLQQVNCDICGKPFGLVSIKFHERQCRRKQILLREKQERDALEAKQRAEEETKSQGYQVFLGEEAGNEVGAYDQTFDAIWQAHVQQLVPCGVCGRTFFPDRIGVHRKWCKGASPLRSKSMANLHSHKQQSGAQEAPNLFVGRDPGDPGEAEMGKALRDEHPTARHKDHHDRHSPERRKVRHRDSDPVLLEIHNSRPTIMQEPVEVEDGQMTSKSVADLMARVDLDK